MGAGPGAQGHLCPLDAFSTPVTLELVLRVEDEEAEPVTQGLRQQDRSGEVATGGPAPAKG